MSTIKEILSHRDRQMSNVELGYDSHVAVSLNTIEKEHLLLSEKRNSGQQVKYHLMQPFPRTDATIKKGS